MKVIRIHSRVGPEQFVYEDAPKPDLGAGDVLVRGLCEKPSREHARALYSTGCLWNSFVMVGRVSAFLALVRGALPHPAAAFDAVKPALGTPLEDAAVRALYGQLPSTNFSRDVLERNAAQLAVIPVPGVRGSDWGEPGRVLGTLAHIGIRPNWAEVLASAPAQANGPGSPEGHKGSRHDEQVNG